MDRIRQYSRKLSGFTAWCLKHCFKARQFCAAPAPPLPKQFLLWLYLPNPSSAIKASASEKSSGFTPAPAPQHWPSEIHAVHAGQCKISLFFQESNVNHNNGEEKDENMSEHFAASAAPTPAVCGGK
jgi:hypothetical protein